MRTTCFRLTSFTLALTMMFSAFPMASAHAGMISTADVIAPMNAQQDRQRIYAVLERADVVAQLQQHGVSVADAHARVAALSDSEARSMADQLENMPAGANSVLGILFSIFIILLVTDLLGLTAVFPFTRRSR